MVKFHKGCHANKNLWSQRKINFDVSSDGPLPLTSVHSSKFEVPPLYFNHKVLAQELPHFSDNNALYIYK